MLKPGPNLKLGVPLLIISFVISWAALFGGAQLVKQDKAAADDGAGAGPGPGPAIVTIEAQNLGFNLSTITANAGTQVTVTLDNKDAGVPHNIAFYTDTSATQQIQGGELITGPAIETIDFTAPAAPGTYFFRCDVHPDQMTGAFVVQ